MKIYRKNRWNSTHYMIACFLWEFRANKINFELMGYKNEKIEVLDMLIEILKLFKEITIVNRNFFNNSMS